MLAALTARRPSTCPSASMRYHLGWTVLLLARRVFIREKGLITRAGCGGVNSLSTGTKPLSGQGGLREETACTILFFAQGKNHSSGPRRCAAIWKSRADLRPQDGSHLLAISAVPSGKTLPGRTTGSRCVRICHALAVFPSMGPLERWVANFSHATI